MTTRDDGSLLIDGETVVWSGRPAQGLLFTSRDWLLIPFSLLWCGFTIFWETTVLSLPAAPLFMKYFGAAFVLIGLYFVAGRFLLDAWVRSGTQYAITNKRVLIARSWPFAKFTALSLNPCRKRVWWKGRTAAARSSLVSQSPIPGAATAFPIGLLRSTPRRRSSASKTPAAYSSNFNAPTLARLSAPDDATTRKIACKRSVAWSAAPSNSAARRQEADRRGVIGRIAE